jgi:glycolate oxidase iron-sulfur subunit
VQYGRLADIGRAVVEERVPRGPWETAKRAALAFALPRRALFTALLRLGRLFSFLFPGLVPAPAPAAGAWPAPRHARRMLALAGCVQPALAPRINAAAARVLDRCGISLIEAPGAGCCGALRFHLNFQEQGRDDMRVLIDAWWPYVERGEVEAVVTTASGCGATVKEYGHLLAQDPAYREKAARISAIAKDLSEVVQSGAGAGTGKGRVAFHSPCSLQHGQQIRGNIESLLEQAGYQLTPVPDAHLCCGSAGTYSILQPALSGQLRSLKLSALQGGRPAVIATANIGCLTHLGAAAEVPVRHWIELLDEVQQR